MNNTNQYISPNDSLDYHLYLQALNSSNSGIIITDNALPDNPIIYCNKAFETISGYKHNEIIGHNCRFLQSHDRSQPERKQLKDAIENGSECRVEIRNYRKDGTLFWNELFVSPVKSGDGQITHFIGVQNDISERKNAEILLRDEKASTEEKIVARTKELQDSEAFLSSIIQTVRESLLVLDSEYRVISANKHFLSTFKVTEDNTVGKVLFELGNHQWDIDALKELLTKILPTNNPVIDFEVSHNFPHIGRKVMLVNAYRIEFEGQFKDRILIAIEDITEQKEIEQRKDDFLSVASHELKTPLTSIKGLIQVLQRLKPENSSEKFTSVLDKIADQTDRLHLLINQLLDTSKIQSGHIELHKEAFEIDQLLTDTVNSFRYSGSDHQINLKGSTNAVILGDDLQIIQVVNNLLSNAIKYSPDEKIVEVQCDRVSNFVKISVTDFGIGISAENQKKIFDRFYRAKDIQQKYAGLGIGLYICQQIIAAHEGTLWVKSEEGNGATFNFTLPIMRINADEE